MPQPRAWEGRYALLHGSDASGFPAPRSPQLTYLSEASHRLTSHRVVPAGLLLFCLILITGCALPTAAGAGAGAPAPAVNLPPRPAVAPLRAPMSAADRRWPGTIELLGTSTNGHPIRRYGMGDGPIHLALVGGIHGGAEWNTVALAYQLIDYISANPDFVADELALSIIPLANPDGLVEVGGKPGRITRSDLDFSGKIGRMNGNDVDLNRNWDCQWQPTSRWQSRTISAGSEPFSEVETQLLRDFFVGSPTDAVIFWHSKAAGVFPGWCEEPYAPSRTLAEAYAASSGYTFAAAWTAYPITGDAGDWLATQGIPAITVELKTHRETDWAENLAGVAAVIGVLVEGKESD